MKILVAIDFSHTTDAVLAETAVLARRLGATVSLLHVTPPSVGPLEGYRSRAEILAEAEADQARLQSYAEPLRRQGIEPSCRAISGEPGPAIVEAIDVEQPDLTILGTHARKGLAHFVMGSVSEFVLRRAKRPVLVVPPTTESIQEVGA